METLDLLGVSQDDVFRFFLEHLRDVTEEAAPPMPELLYNASVLAHYASTSTSSDTTFPACPTSLTRVFDSFLLDHSGHDDAEIMEAAASQCLILTGFFQDQQRRRYNVDWYASVGQACYGRAAGASGQQARAAMMQTMARRFGFWRQQQHRLARDLAESRVLIRRTPSS